MDNNQVTHEEFQNRYGDEVIPYNFDEGPYDGIRCPECEEVTEEDEWEWIDTIAYEQENEFDYACTAVRLTCPHCGKSTTFR